MTAMRRNTGWDTSGGLPALAERAYQALIEQGGTATVEHLVAMVFGARVAATWRPILDGVLANDPRFERCPDGWHLLTSDPPDADRRPLVGLAIATTGSSHVRHRLARLSAVKIEDGRVVGRFDSELNPRRRLPGYVKAAARLSDDTMDEAPAFADVVDAFREFVGDAPLTAYGIAWIMDFLTAELIRAELPGLRNPSVEIDTLARHVLPMTRKPSLQSVAEQIGLNHPRPGYPPADAELAARVAFELLVRQPADARSEDRPGRTSIAALTPGEPSRWLVGAPDGPGVYTVEDAEANVLYVGKALNVRRRLRAYAGRAFVLHRQLEALAVRAARVTTIPTGSDLEARLLEAELIRRHRPPFNVQRRLQPRRALIRAAPHARSPRLHLTRELKADGALYLGPFRSERVARKTLRLAFAVYPLAAARGFDQLDARREAVRAAIRLISGHKSEALARLRLEMRAASASGDRLTVERTRQLVRAVLDADPPPCPLLGMSTDEPMLIVDPPGRPAPARAYLVEGSFLRAGIDVPPHFDPSSPRDVDELVAQLRASAREAGHPEDAVIVQRWLGELTPEHRVIRLRQAEPTGW